MSTNGDRPHTVDDIADEYLLCRDFGHAWAPSDVKIRRKASEIHRILKCRQCPTLRVQVLTIDGYIIPGRSHYQYPEQQDSQAVPYVLKGVGRMNVNDNAHIRVMSTNYIKSQR